MKVKDETRNLFIYSAVIYVLVYVVHRILIEVGYRTFDYCVTHTCGATHNYSYQDSLWLSFNMLPWICIWALVFIWISYYKDNKKPVKE